MTDFLIKSTLCLFVLLAIYHLALEKEKMHQFNRFYLLFSIAFSLAIPFITIEVIDESKKTFIQTNTVITTNATMVTVAETIDYTPIILWSLYGLITGLLLFRFVRNMLKITSRIQSNTVLDYKNARLVLLKEKTLPHTFWNNIFINESDYHYRKIEEELYTHELIHVTQKHTLDVLLIEIVKTLFWFNPIFIFYKKAIQLNHEFLADEKVVNSYNNVPFYQSLLLSKANENQPFYLASNLNYLVTKKRLIMMTKTASKTKAIFKQITLIPIFTGLIFFLCIETIAQENKIIAKDKSEKKEKPTKDRRDEYYAGVRFIIKNCKTKTFIDKQYEQLTLEEKDRYIGYTPKPYLEKSPTEKEFNDFKNTYKYAIWIDGIHKSNEYLNNFKPNDLVFFQGSSVSKNARSKKFPQPFQYNFYTRNYFDKNLKNSWKKHGGKEIICTQYCADKWDKTKNFEESVQKKKSKSTDLYSIAAVTEKPDFPGGIEKFYKFVGENYKTPTQPNLKGKVYITFIIEKDGSLTNMKVLKDAGLGTGDEAIRVLKSSPNWTPGKMDGNPVRVLYSLPITIQSAK